LQHIIALHQIVRSLKNCIAIDKGFKFRKGTWQKS
jgi:hypothetical protein